MLAGIKTGKKKKKAVTPPALSHTEEPHGEGPALDGNEAVAAALRLGTTVPVVTTKPQEGVIMLPGSKSTASTKAEDDMTMAELLVHEKSKMSFAEQEARSLLRPSKRPRKAVDSDDEEEQAMKRWQKVKPATAARRDHSMQMAAHRKTEGVTHKCWWWIESTRFSERRLLASSANVTLSLNHPRCLLAGKHLYLTPIPHTNALANADETVWAEIRQFQESLRRMAAAQNEEVIFWETVLPNHGIWQTRLEALFVPPSVIADAPLYFRSALNEQAEEWGTHQKLRSITSLRNAVPANFDYFYVEYGPHSQHLQMIESKAFPKDFGADTIAGIMDLSPLRMMKHSEREEELAASFIEKFKVFDWTNTSK